MMPPHCNICGKNIRNTEDEDFKLLYFKLAPEQEEAKQRMKDELMVGHPPGAHWFCEKHASRMAAYTHCEYKDAMAKYSIPRGLWARMKAWVRRH